MNLGHLILEDYQYVHCHIVSDCSHCQCPMQCPETWRRPFPGQKTIRHDCRKAWRSPDSQRSIPHTLPWATKQICHGP